MKVAKRPFQIVIQRFTATQDAYGEEVQTWADLATVMAGVRSGTGQERREAAQEQASQAATFLVLWSPLIESVKPTDRVVYNGDWDITSNAPSVEFRKHQEITAVRAA